MGLHSEALQACVTYARTNHIGCVERVNGYLCTCNDKVQYAFYITAHNAQLDFCAFFAAQTLHNVGAVHFHARYQRVVHHNDAVARNDAHLLWRSIHDGLDNHQRVVNDVELHANTFKIALQRFVHSLCFLRISIGRVGVEPFQHTTNGVFHHFLLVHLVYIEVGNSYLCHLHFPHRRVAAEVQIDLRSGKSAEQQKRYW